MISAAWSTDMMTHRGIHGSHCKPPPSAPAETTCLPASVWASIIASVFSSLFQISWDCLLLVESEPEYRWRGNLGNVGFWFPAPGDTRRAQEGWNSAECNSQSPAQNAFGNYKDHTNKKAPWGVEIKFVNFLWQGKRATQIQGVL